jgi:hypothetical protein
MRKFMLAAAIVALLMIFLAACTVNLKIDMPESSPSAPGTGSDGKPSQPATPSDEQSDAPSPTTSTSPETPTPANGSPGTDWSDANTALMGLLPAREGFEWRYFGFAEYGHTMTLDGISAAGDATVYSVSGLLADMSGEASEDSLSIALEYVVSEGKLIQNTIDGGNMDSEFNSIVLLEWPLSVGKTWTQTALTKDDIEVELNCTITDITEKYGGNTYTVRYEQVGADYYEERSIRERYGVVGFTRLFVSDIDRFEIGFSLYDEMSGYPQELALKSLLPPMDTEMRYYGLAEYGHVAAWNNTIPEPECIIYEIGGTYEDGSGVPDKFKIRYILDRNAFTVTEQVVENERYSTPRMNSIIPGLIILKAPLQTGASWNQDVVIDGTGYTVNAVITDSGPAPGKAWATAYTVRYTIEGIPGYFNNTYIEERGFQTGSGMIGFQQLMPGDIGLTQQEMNDPVMVEQAIANHSFGYHLNPDN